jgi:dihydroorotase-like cyclic amidohydrolase
LFKASGSVGADADIVVVNMKARKKLDAQKFYTKAKDVALLYDGFEVCGFPILTIVNGVEVMRDGEITGKPGTGQFVRPC